MEFVFGAILAVIVGAFVTYPFWGRGEATSTVDPELASLEVARDSKYREIRDAETDLASGKLSQEDFDEVNADLRSDAVEILEKLEKAEAGKESGGAMPDEPAPKSGDS